MKVYIKIINKSLGEYNSSPIIIENDEKYEIFLKGFQQIYTKDIFECALKDGTHFIMGNTLINESIFIIKKEESTNDK